MSRHLFVVVVAVAMGCGGGAGGSDPADASAVVADAAVTPDAAPTDLGSFYASAADAVCGALFRCCDGVDQEQYFGPYRGSELLAAWHDRLPPATTLDETSCREVVAEMFAVTPFGDWVAAAERGDVQFQANEFAACISALDSATCGQSVRDALFDGTCLGFSAPSGGANQRRMFSRGAGVGTACSPLRDGIGAAFFGTCDPTTAFCCYSDPEHPELGCTYPYTGDGVPRAGVCKAAAAPTSACSLTPPLAICQTGSSCDADTLTCVAEGTGALAIGNACVDNGFNLLGECVDSFCDVLGSGKCEARRADGAECSAGYECLGGACAGSMCGEIRTCDGVGGGNPDAGPTEPDAMPATPDAGPSAASGETCASALDLLASATASSLPGFDYTVSGTFGATNDYNPYNSANPVLPPACSFVYDAAGAELVYSVVLQPGDDLLMRYDVAPSSVAGGLYLLDECGTTVSWPDYDGSGACGNNEYRSQGYCGALGCDPIEWTFHYPTQLNGNATNARTFWIVVDHLAGAPSGYQLDFRID